MVVVGRKRANKRFIPASTFKTANSLIALEAGVVRDENEVVPYGGKLQTFKRWEQDMFMREAIRISNAPVCQEIAGRVGRERYLKWLRSFSYGNARVGKQVHGFLLNGPLKISAIEQVRFLARLAAEGLNASTSTQSVVADIIQLGRQNTKTLFGKTGWTTTPDPDIGWFVGWVRDGGKLQTFALNMDIRKREDARLRIPLAKRFLSELGVW